MRSGLGVLSATASNYRLDIDPDQLPGSPKRLDAGFKRGLERMNAVDDDTEFPTISKLLASNANAAHREQPLTQPQAGVFNSLTMQRLSSANMSTQPPGHHLALNATWKFPVS